MVKKTSKKWYESKTIWTSIAGVIYAVSGYYTGNLGGTEAITALQIALGAWFIRLGIK